MHENRETSAMPDPPKRTGRLGKAQRPTPSANITEESDPGIVPMNQPNKVGLQATKEAGEGRPGAKENSPSLDMSATQSGFNMSQGLWRVREAAKRNKKIRFTALLHHVTASFLRGCFYALKRQAAPGVDGMTWQEYEQDLGNRLTGLQSRIHRGAYRAQPSRRVYIPKADGRQRPLGIAALEDKIVQQAVVGLLEPIYEEDFLGFSYGFRPGRAACSAGRADCVHRADAGEVDFGCRHSWLLRQRRPRMGHEVCPASGG